MGIALPWALLMGVQAYRHGIKQNKMPEPFYFIWGTAGILGICGIVAMADKRVGIVLAWGLLIGAGVVDYNTRHKIKETATKNANPTAQQIVTRQVGTVASAANIGVKKP